jgi:hypothetical protein
LLLRPIKTAKRRQKKKKSVKRLHIRKKLPVGVKSCRQRNRSVLYNVNCVRKPIRRPKQQRRHKKR